MQGKNVSLKKICENLTKKIRIKSKNRISNIIKDRTIKNQKTKDLQTNDPRLRLLLLKELLGFS